MPSSVTKWTLRSVTSRRAEHRALHGRQVALLDGIEGQAADAGDVEHGLGENSPAEQDPEIEAEDGDDRRDGRAHAVLEDDGPLAQALGSSGADVVLGHRLEQVAA
jgi:hypothetical protein